MLCKTFWSDLQRRAVLAFTVRFNVFKSESWYPLKPTYPQAPAHPHLMEPHSFNTWRFLTDYCKQPCPLPPAVVCIQLFSSCIDFTVCLLRGLLSFPGFSCFLSGKALRKYQIVLPKVCPHSLFTLY